jgi:hypothetical protein
MTDTVSDTVSRWLDAVVAGQGIPQDLFTDDAVLDATIPGFRFAQHGPEHVAGQMTSWFADPGAFAHLLRTPLPGGAELVRFVLTWHEAGEQWAAHQSHVIELEGDKIRRHEMFCGGRWNSERQAEIAQACA